MMRMKRKKTNGEMKKNLRTRKTSEPMRKKIYPKTQRSQKMSKTNYKYISEIHKTKSVPKLLRLSL